MTSTVCESNLHNKSKLLLAIITDMELFLFYCFFTALNANVEYTRLHLRSKVGRSGMLQIPPPKFAEQLSLSNGHKPSSILSFSSAVVLSSFKIASSET